MHASQWAVSETERWCAWVWEDLISFRKEWIKLSLHYSLYFASPCDNIQTQKQSLIFINRRQQVRRRGDSKRSFSCCRRSAAIARNGQKARTAFTTFLKIVTKSRSCRAVHYSFYGCHVGVNKMLCYAYMYMHVRSSELLSFFWEVSWPYPTWNCGMLMSSSTLFFLCQQPNSLELIKL